MIPRAGRRARRGAGGDAASPQAIATVGWDDLTKDQQTALNRLNRGRDASLTDDVRSQLIGLGLAVLRAHGVGISRQGRELVIARLLEARGDAATPAASQSEPPA